MSVGTIGPAATGAVPPSPATANTGQNDTGPTPPQQENSCVGGNHEPLKDMSTETFMALKSQATESSTSMVEGLKEILKILALTKVVEALQQT